MGKSVSRTILKGLRKGPTARSDAEDRLRGVRSRESFDFQREGEGEEGLDDDYYDGQDIGRAEESDHQGHDGDEDGEYQVRF